jgi:hypothetical protein
VVAQLPIFDVLLQWQEVVSAELVFAWCSFAEANRFPEYCSQRISTVRCPGPCVNKCDLLAATSQHLRCAFLRSLFYIFFFEH